MAIFEKTKIMKEVGPQMFQSFDKLFNEFKAIHTDLENLLSAQNEMIKAQISIYELQKAMAEKQGIEIPTPKCNMTLEE